MTDKNKIRRLAHSLERASWLLVFLSMLTQVSSQAFPSYNIVFGFWGAYCSFSKHARATFGLVIFSFFGILLDIIFCSVNGSAEDSHFFRFCLTFFISCLFAKIYQVYVAAQFFASIGGAQAMESSVTGSGLYDSLPGQEHELEYSATGGYYPPNTDSSGFYSNQSGFEVAGSALQPGQQPAHMHMHDSIASLPPSKFYPPMNAHLNGPGISQQAGDGDGENNPMWTGTASV